MPKFTIRISQQVYYGVEVDASSRSEATAKIKRQLDDGDEPDMVEVDSGPYLVEDDAHPETAGAASPISPRRGGFPPSL